MCKNILKMRPSIWYLLALILSSWLLLGASRSKNPQCIHEDKKPYTEQIKKELLEEPSEEKRQDILRVLVDYDAVGAFETVFNTMMNDSAMVRMTAVELISSYFVKVPYYADDSLYMGIVYPERITSQYGIVVDQLVHLDSTKYMDMKISVIGSLIRMGAASEATLEQLYNIASGVNKESWEYVCLECWGRKTKEEVDMNMQKDAIGLILVMNRNHMFEEKTKDYLRNIMNKLDPGSWLFKMIENPVRRRIGQRIERRSEYNATSYSDDWVWNGNKAAEYAMTYCGGKNNVDPGECSPFKFYSSDCANFVSQCLWSGGLFPAIEYCTDNCIYDECCITCCAGLIDYLQRQVGCVGSQSAMNIGEDPDPNACIPSYFSPGDVVILERTIPPGGMHAIISVGPTGSASLFAAHTGNRCGADLDWYIGPGSSEFQTAHFFHINSSCGTDAIVEQFYVLNGTARWKGSSEYKTKGYTIEGSNSSRGPWTRCTGVLPPNSGSYSLNVPSSRYQFFRLVEIEKNGRRIIHEISKARSHVQAKLPLKEVNSQNESELRKRLDVLRSEWETNTINLPSRTAGAGGEKYIIFTTPDLEDEVQSYVADYWESRGYDADIILVPGYPSDPDSVRSSIKSIIAAYADTASAKYFHLIGDANDWREFTGDLSSNYWVSGWEEIRTGYLNSPSNYPEDGQPEKDLIPTFVIPDTLPRGINMATSSPYWFSDQPYADVDNDSIPDVVVTRWPVSNALQVLAMALKMQTHMSTGATSAQKKVAFYVGDRDWYCENCGIGDRARMIADTLEARMLEAAPGQEVEHIYETDYPDPDSLNTGAADLWNSFEPQLVVMVSSRSNRYLPGSYFNKAAGTNPFSMNMITSSTTPFVIGGSCGTADWATTEDPNFGRPVCEAFLTVIGKGAVAWLGPSKGTWEIGNKEVLLPVIERLFSDPHRPMAESWLLALQQVYSAYSDVKPILDVANSYVFLGDPLSPFSPIPRGRVTTFVRTHDVDSLLQAPEWRAVGCPHGDADTLVVVVEINADDVQLPISEEAITISQPQDSSIILFSPLYADSAPTLSGDYYKTTISITEFSGCGRDSAAVYLNDYNLGYAQLNLRSPDVVFSTGSNGKVNLQDFSNFGLHYPSSICNCYYFNPYSACVDYTPPADTTVNLQDFGVFGQHYNHQTSGGGGQVAAFQDGDISSASIKLSFNEDNPTTGPRKLYATVTLENYEPFKVMLMSFMNKVDFLEFSTWSSDGSYPGQTMCTEVIRSGRKEIMLGVKGLKEFDGKPLSLGRIEFNVTSKDSIDLSEDDLSLAFADLLETNGQIRVILTSDVQRTSELAILHNELAQNYPNPFNPTTTIRYSIKQRTHVSLRIYNIAGQLVRILVDRELSPEDVKPIVWDGRNDKDQPVASGIYLYRLATRDYSQTRKLLLLK